MNRKIPNTWKQATIIHILKSDKDKLEPQNYTAISFTSCMAKTFKQMVNKTNLVPRVQQTHHRLPM